MTLAIHPEAKAAMVEVLEERLAIIKVRNGKVIESFYPFMATYEADQKFPTSGKVRDQAEDYVSELPFVEFATETIRRKLYEEADYIEGDELKGLFEIGIFGSPKEFAEKLVDEFCSLPWHFRTAFQLPDRLFPQEVACLREYGLGTGAKISSPTLFSGTTFPLDHPNSDRAQRAKVGLGLLHLGSAEWAADSPYFVREVDGFIGYFGSGNVMERNQENMESFLGLGLATRLFTYRFQLDNPKIRKAWHVHKKQGENWEFWAGFDLDDETAEVVQHIESFNFNQDYPVEQRNGWLTLVLNKIESVLNSEDSHHVILASKWFFDSYRRTDEALRYIRLMTVIEILLGQNDKRSEISLGDLLSNRLAYLIGKDHRERTAILKDFKEVYGLRSSILHRGKHRLRRKELSVLGRLRGYCQRAIEAECDIILGK